MATLPSYRTWTASEIVTAAYLNTNIRDNGNFFLGVPAAELRQTSAQTLTTATPAAILMDTEDLDSDGAHSTVSNTSRYTAQTAGWFQFSGGVAFAASATARRGAFWYKNGATVTAAGVVVPATAANECSISARTKQVQLNGTTDYVELYGYQNSGGNLNTYVAGSDQQSGMSVRWVRSS